MIHLLVQRSLSIAFTFLLALTIGACASKAPMTASVVPPPDPVAVIEPPPAVPDPVVVQIAPEPPPPDPVLILLAESERAFQAGQRELELGHFVAAREQFDKALHVLMASPYGGRTEPRIRQLFDRLVDRISAYEIKSLAEGDGFTEKKYEPASIDELLALSATFVQPPPPPSPQVEEAVQSDLATAEHDVPIPLNRRVLSFVELFQGRLHDFLQEGMKRGSKYLPMIQEVFRAEGIPLDLVYIPLVESAFKPNALSRAKAKGVWQFMRGTGLENGLRQDWYIDERSDPEKATVAAAKYLKTLAGMFDGDWHLAMASYNGGPGRVQRAVKNGRSTDFWKLAENRRLLPRETRDYVPMILAAIIIAKNPGQYGFDFDMQPAHAYETVTLLQPVDLRRVAEWTETTIDEIQALNPELRRWTTPVRDEAYELKVPVGTASLLGLRLTETAGADLASLKWHTVKKGETITTIAKKLRVGRTDLAEANYLKANAKLTPGQQLIVPREPTVLMAAQTDRPIPAADTIADAVPAAAGVSSGVERTKITYLVKKGDTLSSIARLFQTSVASVKSWNRITGTSIRAGERLTIYATQAH
jgi:membrane-bound lytic murein transglycosylase D